MSEGEFEKVQQAARLIEGRTTLRPRIGLVLGSGLGAFADGLQDATAIPYQQIPHFPVSTAVGHAGRLVVGQCAKIPVAVMQGRVHFYEGYSLREVTFPIRVLGALGIRALVFTNAAGGINRKLRARGLLLIRDHLNFQGSNPLLGANDERFGPRFPDMTEAYSKKFRTTAKQVARKLRLRLFEGVYAALHGPSYETPAEIRALARLGADVVGMSTVPEVIVANHMGIEVLGISCVTNMAAGISKQKINHDEVLEAGERVSRQFTAFLRALIPALVRATK
ncbi:MAG: purine-nucleoside phosphorylase [Acidobacteria bacterium]|jgi:purine-nucleoside phosphorylase|nr:purine-nucleoside phosphorylase [Acidobacteriota bacterium]